MRIKKMTKNGETCEMERKHVYHSQRICSSQTKHGSPCTGIAVSGSEHCRHHTTLPIASRIKKELAAGRYTVPQSYGAYLYDQHRSSENPLNLHDEIAILRTSLQQVLTNASTPEGIKEAPLLAQVIEHLRRLIDTASNIEARDKAFQDAEKVIHVTLMKVVVVINDTVKDKSVKQEIARRLYQLGLADVNSETGKEGEGFSKGKSIGSSHELEIMPPVGVPSEKP